MILLLLIGMLAGEGNVTKVDQVLVVKSQRTLSLISQGKVLRTYKVALGGSPGGTKQPLDPRCYPPRYGSDTAPEESP
jgi:hypothetical protein